MLPISFTTFSTRTQILPQIYEENYNGHRAEAEKERGQECSESPTRRTNEPRVRRDDVDSKSIALEVLSRGTREAVFIALRLSLAAAYARRGVMLPLVLDDVLVNFDRERAMNAARTLRTFAELGHQVMMFTCHQHIVEIFQDIAHSFFKCEISRR